MKLDNPALVHAYLLLLNNRHQYMPLNDCRGC